MSKANLFIIGAMKSGTTSLHNYLNEHPQIFMCEPKEPGYFVEEISWEKGEEWYNNLFKGGQDQLILGESSTHYTKRPTFDRVAEKIYNYNPDAKFIYQLRDPVERAISQYWHNVRDLEYVGETRQMIDAVRQDQEYILFSDYAYQLEPYIDIFGKERIYVQTFEKMRDDPIKCLTEIFRWLGVDPDFIPENLNKKWNVMSDELQQVSGTGMLNSIRYSRLWSRLSPLVPQGIKDIGKNMSAHTVTRNDSGRKDAEEYLREKLLTKVEDLETLLTRKFPEWESLNGRQVQSIQDKE